MTGEDKPPRRQECQMKDEGGNRQDAKVADGISHKDAHNAQKEKATGKEKVCWAGVACCAVRYADMDRWTPGYTN
jgi:hypothetical protein